MAKKTIIEQLKERAFKSSNPGEYVKSIIQDIEPGKALVKYEDDVVWVLLTPPVPSVEICTKCVANKSYEYSCWAEYSISNPPPNLPQSVRGVFHSEKEALANVDPGGIVVPVVPGYKIKDTTLWAWMHGKPTKCPAVEKDLIWIDGDGGTVLCKKAGNDD